MAQGGDLMVEPRITHLNIMHRGADGAILNADDLGIVDAAGHYVGTTIEAALAEVFVLASGSTTYTHDQTLALATWTVTHNLAKFPSVTVVDSAGTVVIGTVVYLDANTVELDFSTAFSGKAYLN